MKPKFPFNGSWPEYSGPLTKKIILMREMGEARRTRPENPDDISMISHACFQGFGYFMRLKNIFF